MALLLCAAGIGLGYASFRAKDTPTLSGYGLVAASVMIVIALTIWGTDRSDCWIDWDGRANVQFCD